METKKQTAVEMLIEQIANYVDFPPDPKGITDLINQAKVMEKEQIIEAIDYGCSDWGSFKDVEKYYNETYGK